MLELLVLKRHFQLFFFQFNRDCHSYRERERKARTDTTKCQVKCLASGNLKISSYQTDNSSDTFLPLFMCIIIIHLGTDWELFSFFFLNPFDKYV